MSYGQQPGGYGYGGPPRYPQQQGPQSYYGPPQGRPLGPFDHPSVNTVLVLGLASVFCVGAFAGVPAIILGRRVLADVAREPGRWRSVFGARVGLFLGWVSVAGTAFVVASAVTHGWISAALGVTLAALGLTLLALGGLKNLPQPIASVSATLRRAPLALGLSFAGVLLGSTTGLIGTIAVAQATAQKCADARSHYTAKSKGEDFAATRSAIGAIERECATAATATELSSMRANVAAQEAEAKKRKDAEEVARLAQVAADKEKRALETFPDKSKEIAAMITAAQSKVWQGKVEAADEDYDTARRRLDEFKGTTVEESKGFVDLGTQIAEKKQVIKPQVERVREARRKAEAANAEKERKEAAAAEEKQRKADALAALKAAVRGPKPTNSAWDGSVHVVERYLKAALHDPSSYDHVRTSEVTGEGDYWVVVSSFRGKNAFGALIINTKKFFIQQGEVVKVADVGGDD